LSGNQRLGALGIFFTGPIFRIDSDVELVQENSRQCDNFIPWSFGGQLCRECGHIDREHRAQRILEARALARLREAYGTPTGEPPTA
jgi:hypothetical protein